MGNPLQRLARLPWSSLAVTALLTHVWVFVLEFFLGVGATRSQLIRDALGLLLTPPLGLIMIFAVAIGIGALAVYLLATVYPNLAIDTGILWALVLCLIVGLALKPALPLPESFVRLNETFLIGIVLGVFINGKPYWRR